jgi:hypothetical protein
MARTDPKELVPQAASAPLFTDIADSIQYLRCEAQNRSESILAAVADEMEWLAREVLRRERIDYDRGD